MSEAPIVPIIGGGPAGMSCALGLRNYGLFPIIVEREPALGGMARRSPYPNEGLLGHSGETAEESAESFARHLARAAIEVWLRARPRRLERGGDGGFGLAVELSERPTAQSLSSAAVVLATGTRFAGEEWLDAVENARRLAARGSVHVGAPWALKPGPQSGAHVAVIGGGDNAFDVARRLAEKIAAVTVVMRSRKPRAMPVIVRRLQMLEQCGKARVLAGRQVQALEDHDGRMRVYLDDGTTFDADHVLLLLGYRPNSDEPFLAPLAPARDKSGYLVVDGSAETSCPGVFAVGDVCNAAHPSIASAIASGTVAARAIARRYQTA